MIFDFLQVLLFIVGSAYASQPKGCTVDVSTTICIINNRSNASCESMSNCSLNINQLSDAFLPFYSQDHIFIFLVDELHLLESTLHFNPSVSNITITGLRRGSGGLATIKCVNNSGIAFAAENGHIEISNTAIEGCRRRGAALYFDSNTYGLHRVTVQHSGIGVYAYKSRNQEISHCKFLDNDEGHLKIVGVFSVSIYGTIFYNGSSQKGAGVWVIADPFLIGTGQFHTTYSTIVNITGSVFMKNRAQNGSNLFFFIWY